HDVRMPLSLLLAAGFPPRSAPYPRCRLLLFLSRTAARRPLHSYPTRRSSDLSDIDAVITVSELTGAETIIYAVYGEQEFIARVEDRESTRLNSSHVSTSYAVFCLKTKTGTVASPAAAPSHAPSRASAAAHASQ